MSSGAYGWVIQHNCDVDKKESDRESVIIYMLLLPLTCYHDVFALDIESDESIGTLPVPGVIVMNFNPNSTMMCSSKIDETQSTLSKFMHDITIYTNFSTPHNYNWGKPELNVHNLHNKYFFFFFFFVWYVWHPRAAIEIVHAGVHDIFQHNLEAA